MNPTIYAADGFEKSASICCAWCHGGLLSQMNNLYIRVHSTKSVSLVFFAPDVHSWRAHCRYFTFWLMSTYPVKPKEGLSCMELSLMNAFGSCNHTQESQSQLNCFCPFMQAITKKPRSGGTEIPNDAYGKAVAAISRFRCPKAKMAERFLTTWLTVFVIRQCINNWLFPYLLIGRRVDLWHCMTTVDGTGKHKESVEAKSLLVEDCFSNHTIKKFQVVWQNPRLVIRVYNANCKHQRYWCLNIEVYLIRRSVRSS